MVSCIELNTLTSVTLMHYTIHTLYALCLCAIYIMYFCVIGLDIDNVLEVVILTLSFARYGLIKSRLHLG